MEFEDYTDQKHAITVEGEPQPTVSSQDVSIPAPNSTQEGKNANAVPDPNTTNDQLHPVTINNPEDVHFHQQTHNLHYAHIKDVNITNCISSTSAFIFKKPRYNIHQLLEELILILRRILEELRGEAFLPAGVLVPGRITKPVSLLITKVRQILDDEWKLHRNQREDFQSMYTPEGSIQIEELFDVTKQMAQQEADKHCNTSEAKTMHVARYGNIVCVVGLPGVGKSTFLKMMINCIVVDKSVKPDTQFLFHVSLKNFNPKKKITLLELLLYGNLSEWNHSDEENKELVHFLFNNPNVVILIDGWDQLYTKQANKRVHACQLDSKQIPEVFVKNLMMGNLLPYAAKVITSHPSQFYELHPDYRQGLVTEMHGMTKPGKKNLTKQICGEANFETVERVLADHPNLDGLCYSPVHCIQIIACIHSSVLSGREINSMTDVFIHTLNNFRASEHVRTNMSERQIGQDLVKLAHLAYGGLFERKSVFQQTDFEEVGINKQTVDIFLHTYVEKSHQIKMSILNGKKRSCFTHLIWQELYAAVHAMLFMHQEEFRRCIVTFMDPHWFTATRFMFGICNSTSYEDLKLIFPASIIKDYKKKKNILKCLISFHSFTNENVIRMSGWVHEANDAEISHMFQECMPQDLKMVPPRNPTEISDVVFAFNTFTVPHYLDLQIAKHDLDKASLQTLLQGLHGSQTKIKLTLSDEQLNDEDATHLAGCLGNISSLCLESTDISRRGVVVLKDAIQKIASKKTFKLDGSRGDDLLELVKRFNDFQSASSSSTTFTQTTPPTTSAPSTQTPSPATSTTLTQPTNTISHTLTQSQPSTSYSSHAQPQSMSSYPNATESVSTIQSDSVPANSEYQCSTSESHVPHPKVPSNVLPSSDKTTTSEELDDFSTSVESDTKTIGPSGDKLNAGGCSILITKLALKKKENITLTASIPGIKQSKYFQHPIVLKCTPAGIRFEQPVVVKIESNVSLDDHDSTDFKVQTSDDGKTWKNLTTLCHIEKDNFRFEVRRLSMWRIQHQNGGLDINIRVVFWQRKDGKLVWKLCNDLKLATKHLEKEFLFNTPITISSAKELTLKLKDLNEKALYIFHNEIRIPPCNTLPVLEQMGTISIKKVRPARFYPIQASLCCGDVENELYRFLWEPDEGVSKQASDEHERQPQNVIIKDSSFKKAVVASSNVKTNNK